MNILGGNLSSLGDFGNLGSLANLKDGIGLGNISDLQASLGIGDFSDLLGGGNMGSITGVLGDSGIGGITSFSDILDGGQISDLLSGSGAGVFSSFLGSNGGAASVTQLLGSNSDVFGAVSNITTGGFTTGGFGAPSSDAKPFGGHIKGDFIGGQPIPCTCDFQGIVFNVDDSVGFGTKPILYSFFQSRLFRGYAILKNRWTLGLYNDQQTGTCYAGFEPFCFPVKYNGTVEMMGTS